MRFISPRALHAGAHLQITVRPASELTPPLQAAVAVLRCEQLDDGFDIAASIVEIESVDYPDVQTDRTDGRTAGQANR